MKFQKGQTAWNKGLSKEEQPMFGKHHSKESKLKTSNSEYGKIVSEETCKKLSESRIRIPKENQPMFGKHHSKESNEQNRVKHLGKKHSLDSIKKMSGENNINWKGGTSYLPYCTKFNNKRKNAVRDFFRGYCIVTGEHQNDCLHKHNVHHIDHDKEQGCNGKPFNLIPMNDKEHARELHYEEEYKQYINKTLKEGFKWGIWNEQEYMDKVMYSGDDL